MIKCKETKYSKSSEIDTMLKFEYEYWEKGLTKVAGVDEAGRGPLAGPVVVAAVIFAPNTKIPKVNDSKKLSAKQREELRVEIINTPGVKYSIQTIPHEIIDQINILQATHLGMRESVIALKNVEFALIDGLPVANFPVKCQAIVKGDSKSATIAAASILAKTHRDELMLKYSKEYPEYGFEHNSGYGTAKHLEALKKYGITPIHRKTFAPVRNIINPPAEQLGFDF